MDKLAVEQLFNSQVGLIRDCQRKLSSGSANTNVDDLKGLVAVLTDLNNLMNYNTW